jgi:hypothetical protein
LGLLRFDPRSPQNRGFRWSTVKVPGNLSSRAQERARIQVKEEVKAMSKPKKNKPIKPLEGYTAMSDADVVARGMAVETGLTGNSDCAAVKEMTMGQVCSINSAIC